jgi:hypothetical protein
VELFQGEVPADRVWAVRTTYGDYSDPFIDWFITASTSSQVYQEQKAWLLGHEGGTVARVEVTLPRRRMEAAAVGDWVEKHLLDPKPVNEWIRPLDLFKWIPEEGKA